MTTDTTIPHPDVAEPADMAASTEKLSPAEVQELKELLGRRVAAAVAKPLPELEITPDDLDRFAEHLWSGSAYEEDFSAFGGKLTASFRLRERWEMDLISQQLNADYRDGLIQSVANQQDLASTYNLRFQLIRLNGEDQETKFAGVGYRTTSDQKTAATVREWVKQSAINQMPETRLTILLNWLAQFQNKTFRLMERAAEPSFTEPVGGI